MEHWEHNGKWYVIHRVEGSPAGVQWTLNYGDHSGGGGVPFRSRKELDDYIRRHGLRPAEQLTLGI